MDALPHVRAVVTFLSTSEGGRNLPAVEDGYRPHVVVGDPSQRKAILNGMTCTETYLAVHFEGTGKLLHAGTPHAVTLLLMFQPHPDYDALRPGATFTIREGHKIVGFGTVTEREGA